MQQRSIPDNTAVRVALWRALHVQIDAAPHVLEDTLGLQLAAPDDNWRGRPDMDPQRTRRARASIVARARFIEDLVVEQAARGVDQYVLLGAGLDTFAQRNPELARGMCIFEIDQPATQQWKRQRLIALGCDVPNGLRFVPVDFEAAGSWRQELMAAGFDAAKPAIVSSTGVCMYLTREAILDMLRPIAELPKGSTLAMSFMVPEELVEPEELPGRKATEQGARASGTPFLSFFTPEQIVALLQEGGFRHVEHVSSSQLAQRYFANRSDGLRPSSSEEMIVATT